MREVVIPDIGGEGEQLKVVEWYKEEGDKVVKGELLLAVSSGKVNYQIESPYTGLLKKIITPVDEQVERGTLVAYVDEATSGQ